MRSEKEGRSNGGSVYRHQSKEARHENKKKGCQAHLDTLGEAVRGGEAEVYSKWGKKKPKGRPEADGEATGPRSKIFSQERRVRNY